MAISRMQQPKQLMSNGGILTLADAKRMAPPGESLAYINKDEAKLLKSRGGAGEDINGTGIKSYFLKKAFKKATRAVKKVVKSPIGKAALLGGGLYLAGGGGMPGFLGGKGLGGFGSNKLGGFIRGGFGNITSGDGIMGKVGNMFREGGKKGADFSMGRMLAGGLGAAALAAPFLAGKEEEPEEVGEVMDVANIRNRAQNFYSGMGDKGVGLNFMPDKKYVNQNFYAADGGRAGYAMGGDIDEEDEIAFARSGAGQSRRQPMAFLNMGGDAGNAQAEQMLMAEFVKYKNKGGDLSFEQFVKAVMQQQEQAQGMEQPMMAANGGRIGYRSGGDPLTEFEIYRLGQMGYDVENKGVEPFGGIEVLRDILNVNSFANGGPVPDSTVPGYTTPAGYNKFDYRSGGVRVNAAEGGIMDTEEAEMIDMGGQEKDYRDEGGFVAMGGEERADDVPARLSKNEFVFTADAVRNAGGGDIDRGSEVMQNLMDNLEQGGQVSEDSQGLGREEMMSEEIIEEPNGAQAMYEQQQALQSRMI